MDELKVVGRIPRLTALLLVTATVILAIAIAYVVGAEQGVNSQRPHIFELLRKANPDVLINQLPYMHPLRNVLFAFTLVIGTCWMTLFITVSLQAMRKAFY